MTIPTGLFIDSPESQEVTNFQLSNDPEVWPEEIITHLKERVPDASGAQMIVKMKNEDPETGTAVGAIIMTTGKKAATVPVIIKEFMMSPLDVFIVEGRVLPLIPDYYKKAFMSNEVFKEIEEFPSQVGQSRFEDGNLWNVTYPPSLGRYAYASADYPILSSIENTIGGEQFAEQLKLNKLASALLKKHGHEEMLEKISSLQSVNMNEFSQGVDNLIPRSIYQLRKDGQNSYSLLANSNEVFAPQILKYTRHQMCGHLSKICDKVEDTLNEVDQNGEKIIHVDMPPTTGLYIEDAKQDVVEMANEFGSYIVKKKNGVNVEGFVFPTVIDFNMQTVSGLKVFIGRGMSTLQTDIAGIKVSDPTFKLPSTIPMIGETGIFYYCKDGKGLATIPVTIISIVERGSLIIKATDLNGRGYTFNLDSFGDADLIYKTTDGHYSIPRKMKWATMTGFDEISSSPIDYAEKTASHQKTNSPVTIIKTGSDNYAVRGMDKYAQHMELDKTNMAGPDLRFILASMGASSEKIAQVIGHADKFGHANIHGLSRPELFSEKVAKLQPKIQEMKKIASSFKYDMLKEAGYVENAQTVDALLALNFASPENVSKFVAKIPSFKAAISNLASTLLASRIGIREIPEAAVSTALNRLVEVVNGLEALRATNQEG